MKKSFYFMSLLLGLAVSGLTVSSCSDDDEEGGGGVISSDLFSVIDQNGAPHRVTSWGDGDYVCFDYNEIGLLCGIDWDGDYYYDVTVSGSSITLCYNDNEYKEKESVEVFLNGKGLITSATETYSHNGEDEEYHETLTTTCSYNSAGQLVKIEEKDKSNMVYLGKKYTYSSTGTSNITWADGNATKIVFVENYNDDGEKGTWNEEVTLTYGTKVNPAKQGIADMLDYVVDSDLYLLIPFGLLGTGPANLPSKVTYKDGENALETYTPSYTLYSNGLIKKDGDWSYTYDEVQKVAKKAPIRPVAKRRALRNHRGRHFYKKMMTTMKRN